VVEKTATVVGEVRLNKTSEAETETIHEAVRKEEVRVEKDADSRVTER
jgi:stress response protein YsnF